MMMMLGRRRVDTGQYLPKNLEVLVIVAIEGLEGEAFAREHQHSWFDTLRLINTMLINYNDQALSLHLVCLPVIITCDEISQAFLLRICKLDVTKCLRQRSPRDEAGKVLFCVYYYLKTIST